MTSPNTETSNLLLIGKIISRRNFHALVLHDIVKKAWNPSRHISVRKVDRSSFVFSFEHETDRALAYNRRPWTIRGAHLVLKIWSPDLALTEIDFTSSMFWIQVHGLPLIWCNKENIKLVGSKAGAMVEVEFSETTNGMWQRHTRVRVNVNVNNPLCPGIFLPRHERTDIWISLKYERLPEFCFRCGIIGHTDVHCETNKVVLTNEFGGKFTAFGEWLHSGNDKIPPGIYDKPSVMPVPALMQAGPMLEETPPSSGTICPDGNQSGEVSSFARLLEHALKNACRDSKAIRALRALVKAHSPQIVYLCETKANDSRLKKIASSLGFSEHLPVAAQGKSGVGFYGPSYYRKRMKAWTNLFGLLQSLEGPWLCFGDFNIVAMDNEKLILDFLVQSSLGVTRDRHLGAVNSDHCPLLIDTLPSDANAPKPFRFEAMWTKDLRYNGVISEAWQKEFIGNECFQLCKKQFHTTSALKKWNREVFGHLRHRNNSIDAIRGEDGIWIVNLSEIREYSDNAHLCLMPTPNEIKEAVFNMQSLKSPGPDGLPLLFYKKYWHIVGNVVIKAVQKFFTSGMTKQFKPSRGLRQGDPLSPYLFIICQEVLSRLIDREFLHGNVKGVKMNVAGPAFTHVMYADDIMVFAKANCREVKILDECLDRELKSMLAMKKIQPNAKYLGSPLFNSSSQIKDFKFLQDKLESRLLGWRSKALSWVGRATLIKSVALALPSYTFSSSNVPVAVYEKMDAVVRHFWRAKNTNDALLSKLAWMIASGRDSPCMNALRSVICKGACYLIGDGKSVDCWKDPWVPWILGFLPHPKDTLVPPNPMLVSSLINQERPSWNMTLLKEYFDEDSITAICRIHLPLQPAPDKLCWIADPKDSPKALRIVRYVVLKWNLSPICSSSAKSPEYFGLGLVGEFELIYYQWQLKWMWYVHLNNLESPLVSVKILEIKIIEHWRALPGLPNTNLPEKSFWCPPSPGCIKLNVDAAILPSSARIAVIARDENGLLLKAWAKSVLSYDPLLAEATAIHWAILLAKSEHWTNIMIESDSKVCVDALVIDPQYIDWSILVICDNAKYLTREFSCCSFSWVNRENNMVAHTLAKLVHSSLSPVLYFPKNLPTLLEEAWFRDFSCIAVAI
uniref:CCHC-type domain-containing protein n=1 Tax=Fagus sylvatica TaxID=28930 RepID=A0A2N9FEW4_FAGSY